MFDSTIVRVHQQAAAGRKMRAPKTRVSGVFPRRIEHKIHLLTDEVGLPVAFRIKPGKLRSTPRPSFDSKREIEAVIAEKGYDSAKIVAKVEVWAQSL